MLAMIALVSAPVALPEDGWISFRQPAVDTTSTLGCVGERDVSLQGRRDGWNIIDRDNGRRFEHFTVYLEFENDELVQVRNSTPDCNVKDAVVATVATVSADDGIDLLAQLLDESLSEDVVSGLVAAIAHVADDSATAVLEKAAESADEERSHDALFWLAQRRGEAGRKAVLSHMDPRWPVSHREHAVIALALSDQPKAHDDVRRIAHEHDEVEIRAHAVTALGISPPVGALADLHAIFLSDNSREVRTQALFGIAQQESGAAAETLADIVRDPRHADLRREALFWLSSMSGSDAQAVMDELMAEVL